MNKSKEEIRVELQRLCTAQRGSSPLPAKEFMKRYQSIIGELYRASHPELAQGG